MSWTISDDYMIPVETGQAVGRGWTNATDRKPMGVTWHWAVTRTLAACTQIIGGAKAERKGEASAHYCIGRSFEEGVHRYVSLENRSWHAGINQTLRWDGKPSNNNTKGARATIGIETVHIGYARRNFPAGPDWIDCASPNGKQEMLVETWTEEQIEMMIGVGKEIVARWPHIGPHDHHGHHDVCPGYKVDVCGFPFARVLRDIYDDPSLPDVWTPLWLPEQRQRVLAALGYDIGSAGVDGDWGRSSDSALRAFQRDAGAVEDGMWTTFTCRQAADALDSAGLALAETAGQALS